MFFFFNDTATTEIYTLSLHDALPICSGARGPPNSGSWSRFRFSTTRRASDRLWRRSEEHTSELQSLRHLVCRLLLEKKKRSITPTTWNFMTSCAFALSRDRRHSAPSS